MDYLCGSCNSHDFGEFFVRRHKWKHCSEQQRPEAPSSSFADAALPAMFAGAVFTNRQTGQLLDLLGRLEAPQVSNLGKEAGDGEDADALDCQQLLNRRYLHAQLFNDGHYAAILSLFGVVQECS